MNEPLEPPSGAVADFLAAHRGTGEPPADALLRGEDVVRRACLDAVREAEPLAPPLAIAEATPAPPAKALRRVALGVAGVAAGVVALLGALAWTPAQPAATDVEVVTAAQACQVARRSYIAGRYDTTEAALARCTTEDCRHLGMQLATLRALLARLDTLSLSEASLALDLDALLADGPSSSVRPALYRRQQEAWATLLPAAKSTAEDAPVPTAPPPKAPPPAAPAPAPAWLPTLGASLRVARGGRLALDGQQTKRFAVTDPNVLAVRALDDGALELTGLTAGTTTLLAFPEGRQPHRTVVEVLDEPVAAGKPFVLRTQVDDLGLRASFVDASLEPAACCSLLRRGGRVLLQAESLGTATLWLFDAQGIGTPHLVRVEDLR